MGALRTAVREQRWELAALYLLVGAAEMAMAIPEEALPGLLEALEGEANGEQD